MMYLKQCLSYFKSYSFNHSLPICTLWNKFCICFSCTLVHVYVFQRYICSWYWEIYTSRCLSPIAKNLELSLYYSWYVFGFLAIKSSWILNLESLRSAHIVAQSISCGGVSVLVKSWRWSVKICRYRCLYLCLPFNNLSKLVHKSSSQKAVKIVQRAVYSKKFASCCLPDATCVHRRNMTSGSACGRFH